jgi:hypothetical protein
VGLKKHSRGRLFIIAIDLAFGVDMNISAQEKELLSLKIIKASSKNKSKKPLTREDRIRILEELGIPMASPDDPIYKQGPTIAFIRRRNKQ